MSDEDVKMEGEDNIKMEGKVETNDNDVIKIQSEAKMKDEVTKTESKVEMEGLVKGGEVMKGEVKMDKDFKTESESKKEGKVKEGQVKTEEGDDVASCPSPRVSNAPDSDLYKKAMSKMQQRKELENRAPEGCTFRPDTGLSKQYREKHARKNNNVEVSQ
jgi:hypothetical protein